MNGVGLILNCYRLVLVALIITFIIHIMWAILEVFSSFGIPSIILIINMSSLDRILMPKTTYISCNDSRSKNYNDIKHICFNSLFDFLFSNIF